MANQLKTKFIGNDQVKGEKILLENDSPLRAKNAAGTIEYELIKLDSSDKIVVTGLKNPANDYDAATKKYVDDTVAGVAGDYVDTAGDTMTGTLVIDEGFGESTSYGSNGISGAPDLLLDAGGATGNITLSASNVFMAGQLKNSSSGTGSIAFDNIYGAVDIQGSGGEINIETANNIKLNSAKIDSMGKLQTTEVGYDNVSGTNIQFTNNSMSLNSATISLTAATNGVEIYGALDMNGNTVSGLVSPVSNGQPLIFNQLGTANGVAPLNSSTKIDSIYLPSYVDDVEEYADLSAFPLSGESSKIYVALDTNKTYRWSGSTYIEISPSEVNSVNGETGIVVLNTDHIAESVSPAAVNLWFTDARAKGAAVFNGITDGVTDVAPSQDAVHDALALKLNTSDFGTEFDSDFSAKTTDDLSEGTTNLYFTDVRAKQAAVSDVAYGSGWNNVIDVAPSKNAVYDQMELERARILALESIGSFAVKTALASQDITNGYIDLAHIAVDTNDFHVFVDRLALHQGSLEDYTLSVVGGVTRITFLNDMVSPGSQQLSVGDNIYVRYKSSI